jgi:carbon-monoxide dehydrogenase medium subunit
MQPFDYVTPESLEDATALWADAGTDAMLLAGGTDLTVGLRHGKLKTKLVIDLKRIASLGPDIKFDGDDLRVSAGTTMTQLAAYLDREALFPALQDAAAVVGSIQIRNRATLAGNICNASPAADTVPVLAALGAAVEIAGPNGKRTQTIADFIQGNRKIDLQSAEIVVAVRIPMTSAAHGCAFDRITRRRGVDLATANLCCTVTKDATVFAFGSVAPRPLVVRSSDAVLLDSNATKADRADVIKALCAHATPISDVRASAVYRSAMLCVMAERALDLAKSRFLKVVNDAG